MVKKTELKRLSIAPSVSCHIAYGFTYSWLDLILVDPGSTLIHVGAYDP